MSDRASTQIRFNQLLEDYRKTVLPEIVKNYDTLSEQERQSMGKLCNFFCGLHALVHLAEMASKSLLETQGGLLEEDSIPIFDKSFLSRTEPGATRLTRTACKAAAEGGDEKSGCHGLFLEFMRPTLKIQGYSRLPIEPFHGNRFNVLFKNAASVFFLAENLNTFLETNATNKLLKSVKYDLNVSQYLAGCKALGLVSYLVTMPLWSSIEDSNIHIMDIGVRYQEIIDYLVNASSNVEEFMNGRLHLSFSDRHLLQSDLIFQKLRHPWEHDDMTEAILTHMLSAMASLLKRMFADHLEGGRWSEASASQDIREKTKGLPKHNKFAESIFGHLDRLMREKPSITTVASEACIMFAHNKTMQWLQTKTQAERAHLFAESRKAVKTIRDSFRERHKKIQEARRILLMERMKEAEELEKRRVQKKEGQTADIIYWGLWQSEEAVETALSIVSSKKDKIAALKAQLNFRNNVLEQKPVEKGLYAFSKVGENGVRRQLGPEELTENLKKLIQHASSIETSRKEKDPTVTDRIHMLVGKRVRHRFVTDDTEKFYIGRVISQVGYLRS